MRPPNVLYEVILTWDGKSGDDLDLWVQSASGHLVGFNRREGGHGVSQLVWISDRWVAEITPRRS